MYIHYSKQKEKQDLAGDPNMNSITRASWYAAEALGSIFGQFGSNKVDATRGLKYRQPIPSLTKANIDFLQSPSSLDETLMRIQLDNDRCYFLSGQVDAMIYDPNCLFSDPFVSFYGRERFINNLKNLGTFITRFDAKLLSCQYLENKVETKILVKLELNLPWKPILAWPWGVSYEVDPSSNLIVSHRESWDIEPWDVR